MGILIACEENKAKLPYRFKVTGTSIYTAEELYYYIYHNMLLLTDELYEEAFLAWLENELCLKEKAEKIRELKKKLSGYDALTEAALVLLSGDCYYKEEEVQNFLIKQSERKNVSPTEMAVKKAESFLQHGRYFEAEMIYESLLAGDATYSLLKEEAGRIRHNQGICRLHTEGFKRAAKDFKAAYEMTGREESKRQYVLCVLLSSTDGLEFIEPLKSEESSDEENIDKAYVEGIREEIRDSLMRYKSSSEYKESEELKEAKEDGKLIGFTQGARKIIHSYKQEYRSENS
ncbi:hypothetical protein [Anaerocolumna xylanovorans]|uniref:Tetratricopeptide repeat-containing protein n=1 Tax=Anaerocolumna xylanovorans DSM 12503 TaxID=1121345 RepID=A0A1M7YH74_9FIRM|nr:hypothetical protein [Anaerocolumna xylanovorans]SHO51931.1 hypothetical protein SAMN02745217_03415 [Anaerocolumna xylanovorans DSM 12503]